MASRRDDDLHVKLAHTVGRARQSCASLVVFGHWHIPLVYRREGVTAINPGALASGNEIFRQLHQTAALLYLLDTGGAVVNHVDLAEPGHRFETAIDFDAGFNRALKCYSPSILDPTLTAVVPNLRQTLPPDQVNALRELVLNPARRCWADEVSTLKLEMLMMEMDRSDRVEAETKRMVREIEV